MTAMRRSVRAIAIVWLLCQAGSLSAFVPAECCVSHAAEVAAKAATASAEACHEAPPAEPKEGDACPMHHGSRHADDRCVMTNACDGPGTQLLGLFAFIGILETPASSSFVLDSVTALLGAPPPLLHQLTIPDAPPPKA